MNKIINYKIITIECEPRLFDKTNAPSDMEKYLNALDKLIKQSKDMNDELDKCLNLQEQTIEELKRTNKILDDFNVA